MKTLERYIRSAIEDVKRDGYDLQREKNDLITGIVFAPFGFGFAMLLAYHDKVIHQPLLWFFSITVILWAALFCFILVQVDSVRKSGRKMLGFALITAYLLLTFVFLLVVPGLLIPAGMRTIFVVWMLTTGLSLMVLRGLKYKAIKSEIEAGMLKLPEGNLTNR